MDRIVLNIYLRMGRTQDWVRVRWRALTASDDSLENALLDAHGRSVPFSSVSAQV